MPKFVEGIHTRREHTVSDVCMAWIVGKMPSRRVHRARFLARQFTDMRIAARFGTETLRTDAVHYQTINGKRSTGCVYGDDSFPSRLMGNDNLCIHFGLR